MLRRRQILQAAVVLLALETVVYLGYEFWRLVLDRGYMGAIDFVERLRETHAWFAGLAVYGRLIAAFYPPATYAILWPFTGWLGADPARWLWAVATVVELAWLALLMLRGSGAQGRLERALVVLMLLAIYPTGQTIGNGQFFTLVLPLVVSALLLSRRAEGRWYTDLLIALLLLVALVKPTGVLPFLLIPCFVPGRKRPLVVVAVAYVGVTVLAASFQKPSVFTLVHQWVKLSGNLGAYHGWRFYANVHAWLGSLGLKSLIFPVSIVILVAFALWIWRHRHVDLWLLIGVAALVARFWTYHQSYDDMLIVLPMVALFRIAKTAGPARDRDIAAGVLLAVTFAVMAVPGGLFLFPRPLRTPFTTLETLIWFCGLVFLIREARVARLVQAREPAALAVSSAPA